eukprot:CAMPEP_0170594198 /NCGR_PEP_ID=MMETSP0224-20130122/13871_1 /TAXON_ID=285029 /ORGANISM="Togula jolla, Strain CCCM 725" /LENGTH=146 /DNA_ID=CAMNT_0010918237 /DNA_START=478 /DNA_END=917 /DNA_ORIENTATION=+
MKGSRLLFLTRRMRDAFHLRKLASKALDFGLQDYQRSLAWLLAEAPAAIPEPEKVSSPFGTGEVYEGSAMPLPRGEVAGNVAEVILPCIADLVKILDQSSSIDPCWKIPQHQSGYCVWKRGTGIGAGPAAPAAPFTAGWLVLRLAH